jgi:hypothetical protein
MRSTLRLDTGLSLLVRCVSPLVTDRETRTHRRGRSKRSYGPLPAPHRDLGSGTLIRTSTRPQSPKRAPNRTEATASSRGLRTKNRRFCRSFLSKRALLRLPENRGVPGSSPGLAIPRSACKSLDSCARNADGRAGWPRPWIRPRISRGCAAPPGRPPRCWRRSAPPSMWELSCAAA